MTRDAGRRARPKHPPSQIGCRPRSEREAEKRGVDGTPTSPASCPPEITEKPKGVGVPETAQKTLDGAKNVNANDKAATRRVKPQPTSLAEIRKLVHKAIGGDVCHGCPLKILVCKKQWENGHPSYHCNGIDTIQRILEVLRNE